MEKKFEEEAANVEEDINQYLNAKADRNNALKLLAENERQKQEDLR